VPAFIYLPYKLGTLGRHGPTVTQYHSSCSKHATAFFGSHIDWPEATYG